MAIYINTTMKNLRSLGFLSALIAFAALPSCGLVRSAAKVPGSIIKSVGRTVGMPVSHTQEYRAESPSLELIGDGEIEQLD